MRRLIDANAVRQKLQEIIDETQNWRNQKASKIDAWRYVDEIYKLDNWLGVYAECADLIDEAPTVSAVEVVHARWENVQNGKGCCSNCNRLDSIDNLATHCRYCGAKMDGGNEDG